MHHFLILEKLIGSFNDICFTWGMPSQSSACCIASRALSTGLVWSHWSQSGHNPAGNKGGSESLSLNKHHNTRTLSFCCYSLSNYCWHAVSKVIYGCMQNTTILYLKVNLLQQLGLGSYICRCGSSSCLPLNLSIGCYYTPTLSLKCIQAMSYLFTEGCYFWKQWGKGKLLLNPYLRLEVVGKPQVCQTSRACKQKPPSCLPFLSPISLLSSVSHPAHPLFPLYCWTVLGRFLLLHTLENYALLSSLTSDLHLSITVIGGELWC